MTFGVASRYAGKYPLSFLAKKILEKVFSPVTDNVEAVSASLFPGALSDREFFSLAGENAVENAFKKKRVFLPAGAENVKKFFGKTGQHTGAIEQANRIKMRRLSVLGLGETAFDGRARWRTDSATGFEFPKSYYKKIKPIDLRRKADIRIVWELNRCHHFSILGQAYLLSGDESFANEFRQQALDWIHENPFKRGPAWRNAMEASLRSINWIYAFCFFASSESIPRVFWTTYLKVLYLHGRFIRENLEWAPIRGNHYLADLLGLLYLGVLFDESKEAREWLEFTRSELEKEMREQVFREGTDYECSAAYHYFATELFFHALVVAERAGKRFPKWFRERVHKMLEFIAHCVKPGGLMPLIGDSDDGRVLKLSPFFEPKNAGPLLSAGAAFFGDAALKRACLERFYAEAFALLGNNGFKRFKKIKEVKAREAPASKAFWESGFYVMRDENVYLLARCGPLGLRGLGSHSHNELLSFELNVEGSDVFVDSGTYCYSLDPEARNLFRSTAYHNTVRIDGLEQNTIYPNELFRLFDEANAKALAWRVERDKETFSGEHYGYAKLPGKVVHRRSIEWRKAAKEIVVKDEFRGAGRHLLEWFYHVKDNKVALENGKIVVEAGRQRIVVTPLWKNPDVKQERSWYSEAYGSRKPGRMFKIVARDVLLPCSFVTKILY